MAIDDSPSSIFAPWPDRLRHAALILLAAALALSVVVALGELSLVRACAVFVCIAAAALVPWRLAAQSPTKTHRVGMLSRGGPISDESPQGVALVRGLAKRGYSLGSNLTFDRRAAFGRAAGSLTENW